MNRYCGDYVTLRFGMTAVFLFSLLLGYLNATLKDTLTEFAGVFFLSMTAIGIVTWFVWVSFRAKDHEERITELEKRKR